MKRGHAAGAALDSTHPVPSRSCALSFEDWQGRAGVPGEEEASVAHNPHGDSTLLAPQQAQEGTARARPCALTPAPHPAPPAAWAPGWDPQPGWRGTLAVAAKIRVGSFKGFLLVILPPPPPCYKRANTTRKGREKRAELETAPKLKQQKQRSLHLKASAN